jgi:hypothetical protein
MKKTMKSQILQLAAHVLVLSAMSASAAIRYVNVNSTSPTPPYTNWTTAATTIQDAVDAAVAGDQILVTNGVYQTGGRVVSGAMKNRVAVNKPVMVLSVNGAAATVIQGSQLMRCVYLISGAALMGFTLTNGVAGSGGGVWCESASAVVSNCVLTANSAGQGGGASGGTLYHCTINGNSADGADGAGGGVAESTLYNCTLTRNSASLGGGAYISTLNNCTLNGNSASVGGWRAGGGAYLGTLNNCTLSGNSAYGGGGVAGGTLNNCTLMANSAIVSGGGASGATLNNCIVYYNRAPKEANCDYSILSYSCTTPLPPEGVGNISAEPQLADFSHLVTGSPCRGAGNAAYATGLDIDGESWANPPSIGCDEYYPGAVTGPLSVSIQAAYTSAALGVAVNFTAAIDGRPTANRWEFGDGTVLSNRPFVSHSWSVVGDYSVVFQAYNDTYPSGIAATVTVHVVAQPVHYVAAGSANPVAPYTSWATAASNIQDAVDAASEAGAQVLVTNGVYQTGKRLISTAGMVPNRVAVTKPIMVRSVNGAAVTVIQGYQDPAPTITDSSVRCVYLTSGATLVGFTLTHGGAPVLCITSGNDTACTGQTGGGVMSESASAVVSNCVLIGNSANYGGGASGGTLYNCTLSGNSTTGDGGGAAEGCTLHNCTLTGNSASYGGGAAWCTLNNCSLSGNSASSKGGGAYGGTLNNCIAYYNHAPNGDNYSDSILNYSCTTPLPTNGVANLTNAPLFVNQAGGNLRLQSNSPCVNAGSNASAPASPDLDGNPRIVGSTVDIGAYEFQSPQSLISYAWLQQYNLPINGSADYTDADGDGMNNWQEWRAGTNPTNALSVLRLLSPASAAPGVIVSWQSVSGRNYFLERGTRLGAQPPFFPLATNIVGQPGTTTFTDTNAVGAGPFFYRIGVQE